MFSPTLVAGCYKNTDRAFFNKCFLVLTSMWTARFSAFEFKGMNLSCRWWRSAAPSKFKFPEIFNSPLLNNDVQAVQNEVNPWITLQWPNRDHEISVISFCIQILSNATADIYIHVAIWRQIFNIRVKANQANIRKFPAAKLYGFLHRRLKLTAGLRTLSVCTHYHSAIIAS